MPVRQVRWNGLAQAVLAFAGLALLAALPYLPVLVQPFLSDDYVQLDLGRHYGPVESWGNLLGDALYRCRATSILLTHWTETLFGTAPLPYYSSAILLHIVNTWLVLLVGRKLGLGGIRSLIAAGFFAVHMGHQEAVMWYAALPELLLFFFCALFLLSWNSFLRRGSEWQYALAALWFVMALLSKEAAVVLVPAAAAMSFHRKSSLWRVVPLAVAGAAYALAIFAAKSDHLHLRDGTFSLHAPFLLTWARSLGRMFWVWSLLGLTAALAWNRNRWRQLIPAAFWAAVALLPFSFLLYMPFVPSRHTYLASAALGFFVAAGLIAVHRRFPAHRWAVPLLMTIVVAQNVEYIWGKKRRQFLERAAATEDLVRLARRTDGLIYITCFPYAREVAELALTIHMPDRISPLVWDKVPPPGATSFCAKDP